MLSVKQRLETPGAERVPTELCVFDIETGGLSPRYSPLLLLGLAYVQDGCWMLEMHLAERPDEEPLLLSAWNQAMHRFLLFLSYNGRSFDLPFLRERSNQRGLALHLAKERHLDLYERGKLKEAEKESGFLRTDTLSGKEWVSLYRDFVRQKLPAQKEALLRHNAQDLTGTVHLLHARTALLHSLPHRFLSGRFLFDYVPAPGNLRLRAIDSEQREWILDLPLLSFGRFHFLDVGAGFDHLLPEEKEKLLLLIGREAQLRNIAALTKENASSPFFIDKTWRQC